MNLKLKKDIVFLDLETTGVNVSKDKIIQIGIIKYFADGREPVEKSKLINPGVEISETIEKLTHITNEQLKEAPFFKQVARGFAEFIGDSDIAGYNSSRFDIPMLMQEFDNAGIEFSMDGRMGIDAFAIYQKMEKRNLKAAVKFFLGEEMSGQHDALNDARYTTRVLFSQIEKYKGQQAIDMFDEKEDNILDDTVEGLHNFTLDKTKVDYAGKFKRNENGDVVFSFGKHMGKKVFDTIKAEPGYYNFILNGDFTNNTKEHLKKIMEK